MNIKILGPGCFRCHQLEKTTKEAVKELGIDASIEHTPHLNFLWSIIVRAPNTLRGGKKRSELPLS